MPRFLIYLFPAVMDMMLGGALFVGAVRVSDAGGSATAVTAVLTTWALTYAIASQFVGRLVTSRNSGWLLIAGSLLTAACAGAFVAFPQIEVIYVLTVMKGVATALFFIPFQIFMKAVEQDNPQGLVRPTALYTLSWSSGIAVGPFVCGFIFQTFDWQWCHAFNAVAALITAAGLLLLRHHADGHPPSPASKAPASPAPTVDYSKMPDLAWLAWVCSGGGILVLSLTRGLFPKTGSDLDISKFQQGIVLAILSGVQGLTGLCLIRSRTWMYRAGPVALFALVGCVGAVLFGLGERPLTFYAAAACLGVYSGSFFFYFVFHALVHPERSARYVAINESVVGTAAVVGTIGGGMIADQFGHSVPYLASAGLVAAILVFQAAVHRRTAAKECVLPKA